MVPRLAPFIVLSLLLVGVAGCAERPQRTTGRVGGVPYGWDEEAPERSDVAHQVAYRLDQSSSFLIKGASYARYLMRVDQPYDGVELFFTSTNENAPNATKPAVKDFVYHYEFMQLRPLGARVRVMDVNADPAFSNANTQRTFTLAYIYGNGANYQYLAPYQGDPGNWHLDRGYYELVIATDQELTVGVNVKLGTPLWSTYYDPQELGSSRASGLRTYVQVWPGATPRELHQSFDEVANAKDGETLNYFVFSDLIYRSNLAAVGAQGSVHVRVDDQEVPHRLDVTGAQPQRAEAFAYAVSFNEAGPVRHELKTQLDFSEDLSLNSDLAAQMLVFSVVLHPERSLANLPTAPAT